MDEILSRTWNDLAKPILFALKIDLDPGWRELGVSYFNNWLRPLKWRKAAPRPVSPCFQYW
jgi:hypothetical protein